MLAIRYIPGHGRVYDRPWVESVTGEAIAGLFDGWQPWALETIKVCLHPVSRNSGTDQETGYKQ